MKGINGWNASALSLNLWEGSKEGRKEWELVTGKEGRRSEHWWREMNRWKIIFTLLDLIMDSITVCSQWGKKDEWHEDENWTRLWGIIVNLLCFFHFFRKVKIMFFFNFLIMHFQVTMSTHLAKSAKLTVLVTHQHKLTLLGPFETIGTNSIKRCKL